MVQQSVGDRGCIFSMKEGFTFLCRNLLSDWWMEFAPTSGQADEWSSEWLESCVECYIQWLTLPKISIIPLHKRYDLNHKMCFLGRSWWCSSLSRYRLLIADCRVTKIAIQVLQIKHMTKLVHTHQIKWVMIIIKLYYCEGGWVRVLY